MQIQIFHLSVAAEQSDIEQVNRFLASHKVVKIDKQFVEAGESSFWTLLVTYTSDQAAKPQTSDRRVDYKEILDPDDFAVFSKLRNVRKELAEKDGVPVYAVFTNEQLAEIAKQRVTSLAGLAKIKGVGKAKVDKYGAAMAKVMAESATFSKQADDGKENRSNA